MEILAHSQHEHPQIVKCKDTVLLSNMITYSRCHCDSSFVWIELLDELKSPLSAAGGPDATPLFVHVKISTTRIYTKILICVIVLHVLHIFLHQWSVDLVRE